MYTVRIKTAYFLRLIGSILLVLAVILLPGRYWEDLENNLLNHIKSYSYRYLINRFDHLNSSLRISPEQASRFSNFKYLLDHPGKCAGQQILLLLFVKSAPENFERRDAIRQTWGNEEYIQNTLGATVKVLYVLGAPSYTGRAKNSHCKRGNHNIQSKLVAEDRLHGDLVQKNFVDSFYNLTLKLIVQFHWMHERCAHARFFMTADDDVFIHTPNLVAYLRDQDRRGVTDFWVGSVHRGSPPVRCKYSKYHIPYDMYQWISYPDYTAGGGYVVSGDLAAKIYEATLFLNASLFIDDVYMGICANSVGVLPQQHLFFSGEYQCPKHPCIYKKMITSHAHVKDVREMWGVTTGQGQMGNISGLLIPLYCMVMKVLLLCRPFPVQAYPCIAAFL